MTEDIKINKPTQKQAIEVIEKKVFKEMKELEQKLSNQRLFLLKLWAGRIQTEIKEYEKNEWLFNAHDWSLNVSHYAFKTKIVDGTKKVSRY